MAIGFFFGVRAEQRQLEDIAEPLTAEGTVCPDHGRQLISAAIVGCPDGVAVALHSFTLTLSGQRRW